MLHRDAIAALAREGARSRRALVIERAAAAALTPVLGLLAWIAVSLAGAQDALPPLAATLLCVAALAALAWLALRGLSRWSPPTPEDVRARLNRDSGLPKGALEALGDSPINLDAGALALWRREQERTVEVVARARAAPPRLELGRADPWRLRFILPVLVLAAALFAGPAAPDRLARAFIPDPGPLVGDGPIAIEAWATPAAYTGGAPVSLSDRIGDRIETPPSPEATVRVTGPAAAPWLVFDGKGKTQKIRFVRAADGAWEAKADLGTGGSLRVVRFLTRARWTISPAPDAAPEGAFVAAPKVGEDDKIVFEWRASDDFGVTGLLLRLTPVDPPPGLKGAKPVDTALDSPAGDPRAAEGSSTVDLSAHPYAGMTVKAQLVVRDALGQEGVSDAAELKVPEKIFLQPLARVAIEIRKIILHERRAYAKTERVRSPRVAGVDDVFGIRTDDEDPRIERAPAAIRRAGRMLDAITMAPEDGYFHDQAVFAGFRLARATLDVAREIGDTDEAADILWQVAMRAEYGDSADAKRALEEAQRRLAEAIQRGASAEEIARLAQAMQQAMQNYMQALVQEAIREGRRQEQAEDAQQQNSLSMADIQRMMEEVQRRAEAGDTEGAQALLQQLAQLLNNMEVSLANQNGEGGDQGEPTELEQAVEGLSEQIGKQRQLRDETGEEQQRRDQGQESPQDRAQNGQQQQELGQRQEQLGADVRNAQQKAQGAGAEEGGQELADAGEAMDRAAEALRKGNLGEAGRLQDQALRDLRRGAEQLSNEALAKREGHEGRQGEQRQGGERDPLGRMMGASGDGGNETAVPTEVERQRAREILDELRRRAQDPRRPEAEREYLRRLLDRFTGS
jgi:ribosomal protein S20